MDTDVLITHGPPYGILDVTDERQKVGCEELMKAVLRVQPKVHIFGHIHEAYGEHQTKLTHFVNACNCDIYYRCVQKPIVVDLEIS